MKNTAFAILIKSVQQKQPFENTLVGRYIIMASAEMFPVWLCLLVLLFSLAGKKCIQQMQHRPMEEISAGGQLIFFVVSCLCHLKSCCHWHVSLGDGFTNVDVSLSAVESYHLSCSYGSLLRRSQASIMIVKCLQIANK